MVQIFKDTYEDLTPASFEKLIDDFAAGRAVRPGPQIDRQLSAPEGGPTTLTGKSIKPVPAAEAKPVAVVNPAALAPIRPTEPKPPRKPAVEAAEGTPALVSKPRGGKGDDLKLIWGIGPKLEKMLNRMGIWHFDQIAAWSAAELKWVDERLEGFRGRAKRDGWVKQAKKLATGWRPSSAGGDRPRKQ
jgi:NADH-quinone oxidoreductase subunit E